MITQQARSVGSRFGKAGSALQRPAILLPAGFLAAGIGTLLLRHVVGSPTAGAWLYLPLTLLVTLRWALLRGLVTGVASGLVAFAIVLLPFGVYPADDPLLYIRLLAAVLGSLMTVTIAAGLNRRLTADQRGRAEAETLAEISRRVSASLDLGEVLKATAESAKRLVAADVISIGLTDSSSSQPAIALVGSRSAELEQLATPNDAGITARVIENGRPMQMHWDDVDVGNISHPPALRAMRAEGIVSTLAMPIRHGAETVGVFWVHSRTHRQFSQPETALLDRLAAQAGVAISNARAHQHEQEARAEVEALLKATANLGIQAEPEEVLRTLVVEAAKVLEADHAIYAIPRDGKLVIPAAWQAGVWTSDEHEAYMSGIVGMVWNSGSPYRTNDLAHDPNRINVILERYQIRSQLTVALLGPSGERLGIGSLSNSRRPGGFSERDERVMVAICETASAILLRANETRIRLQAEQAAGRRKQEVEALLAAADQLSSVVKPEDVLLRVVSIATDVLAVQRAGIATNDGDHAVRRYTLVDGVWRAEETHLSFTNSMTGWVIQNGRSFRTSDFGNAPFSFHAASSKGMPQTAMSVPMLGQGGRVLGALQLFERRDGQAFSEDDQRLAEGIAYHAAVALERARTTAELRQLADALKTAARFNEEVIAGASQGMVVYDRELRYVAFNPFMERLTGLTAQQVLGKAALDVFPDLRPTEGVELLYRALRGETVATPDTPYNFAKTGRSGWLISTFAPHRDASGAILGVIGTVNEVTDRKALEQRLERQAFIDPLTALPNRAYFMDRLTHALNFGSRRDRAIGVLFLDLDGFKVVNDSLGHPAGDALLRAVSERLLGCRRETDTIARFGGDEFAVLLESIEGPGTVSEVAGRILRALERPFSAAGHEGMLIGTSIGMAFRISATTSCSAEELIREADIAMYGAKSRGKGRAEWFAPSMGAEAVQRLEMETDLQQALGRGEFCLLYQPYVRLCTGKVAGVEALLRWNHPRRGLLAPDAFILVAEETGAIFPIGRWVLEQSCKEAVVWQPAAGTAGPFRVSVNLSARQFEQPDLVEQVALTLQRSGLPPQALVLEITETAVIRNPESAVVALAGLRSLGLQVAIDDFGTGYSSLSYLERLKPDILKIDRSFTQRLEDSSPTEAIVRATIVMAHALGMEVTAEGIETTEQASVLGALSCDYGQGYYLARPGPAAAARDTLLRIAV